MFGSTLPPVVCRRAHVLLCFVCMFAHFAVAHLFSFLCFVFCFVCLRPVSYVLTVIKIGIKHSVYILVKLIAC